MKSLLRTIPDQHGKYTGMLTNARETIQHFRASVVTEGSTFVKKFVAADKLAVLVKGLPDEFTDELFQSLYEAFRDTSTEKNPELKTAQANDSAVAFINELVSDKKKLEKIVELTTKKVDDIRNPKPAEETKAPAK